MLPKMAPPGEVAEMMRPHESTRGPASSPSSTAWRHGDALVVVAADIAHGGDARGQQLARPPAASTKYPSARCRGSSPDSGSAGPNPGLRWVSLER